MLFFNHLSMQEIQKIEECSSFILHRVAARPRIGVVLGSGLGGLVAEMQVTDRISYRDIPHFPVSTVAGHHGELVFGTLSGIPLCVLNGRKHFYEGVSMREVVFPILVLKAIGIDTVILSNAAGGLNSSFQVGDVMVMTDHISHFWASPVRGDVSAFLNQKRPVELYSLALVKAALQTARNLRIPLQHGVYLAHSGPYYGTAAESRMQRAMGADAVGMSTCPEAVMAGSLGMKVLAFSVITDLAYDGVDEHPSHEAVLRAANTAGEKLVRLVSQLVSAL